MFKKLSLAAAALTMTAGALVPATAADAQGRSRYERGYGNYDRGYDDRYERRQYRDRRGYNNARRCRSGDTGTLVGAIAGGLLGRTIDTRGDRLLGTVLGAGGGALAGRAIERSSDCGRRYR
ncbi:MAG TPA: glycine zipper 2TM domain-containing protein [Sphingomonas sp.]|jgi:hypothetical protein|uniref:glycine zipper 2TM domain-containing protein n=1 Tax=Sphingomonas sp. TaxID=28214 RepID=UPI002ED93D33